MRQKPVYFQTVCLTTIMEKLMKNIFQKEYDNPRKNF